MLLGRRGQTQLQPTWRFDFKPGVIPVGATYTGNGGKGTYMGADGLIHPSTNNVPRFDYDPVTHVPLGYLAEMQSTNSLLRSEALDNASWTKSRVTISANATTAPDGNVTADKMLETVDNDTHQMSSSAMTVVANAPFSASIFVKAAEDTAVSVVAYGNSGTVWFGCTLDLSAGTVAKTGNGASGTLISATIRSVGNGWYRVALVGSLNDTSATLGVWMVNTTNPTYGSYGATSFIGNTSNGLYAWGGQLEAGGVGVTSYIPTAGATATRAQDVLSLPLTALPGWNASQGGVLVAAYRLHTLVPSSPGYNQMALWLNNGGANNDVELSANQSGLGTMRLVMDSGGVLQLNLGNSAASPAAFVRRKQAGGWSVPHGINAYGGVVDVTGGTATVLPVGMTTLDFGRYGTHGLNGTLESIAYYAGARSDAFVQAASR